MANELTVSELCDEVQAITGRVDDTELVTDTRIARWLNEAQRRILDVCPHHQALKFQCSGSIDFSTDKIKYLATDITYDVTLDVTTRMPMHIENVWLVSGAESRRLTFMPPDEFDQQLIDPTHTDAASGKPLRWTLRGHYIQVAPRPSSEWDSVDMRLDCVRPPRDMTAGSSNVSDISDSDKGLIYYAASEAWAAIGDEVRANIYKRKFDNPDPKATESYGFLQEMRDRYDQMNDSWDFMIWGAEE